MCLQRFTHAVVRTPLYAGRILVGQHNLLAPHAARIDENTRLVIGEIRHLLLKPANRRCFRETPYP
jgi:hypothetical protein